MLPEAPILLADTGNFSDNPTPAGDAKTRALLEGMVRLGYQVANVGERDLNGGFDALQSKLQGLPLTLVSANVVRQDTKQPVFKPWVVLPMKGGKGKKDLRVGVIGLVRFNPVFQKAGPGGSNLVIQQPLEALQKHLPELREKSDLVVVLAALHKDDARNLIRAASGIDFVLGAFANMVSAQDEVEGPTHIRYAGNQGKYVSETRVFLAGDRKVASVGNYMHSLIARYPDDPATLTWLAGQLKRVQALDQGAPAAAPGSGGH